MYHLQCWVYNKTYEGCAEIRNEIRILKEKKKEIQAIESGSEMTQMLVLSEK